LARLNPDIVVHTAGPYQDQDYSVARACLAVDSHYLDLADGREFVAKFSELNEGALEKNLLLVSGASTLPGLSSVVISEYESEFSELHEGESTIAPAHKTPRGRSTIAAVLSYCGKPFTVLENGEWCTRYGWADLRRVKYPNLGSRIAAACDVPDLSLLPEKYPTLRTATFHAALEAPWEQLVLWGMALLSRVGMVRNWSRFSGVFESVSRLFVRFGSDCGGMSIRMSGIGIDGQERQIVWYIKAGENHGPEIPCTPPLVLVRLLLNDQISVRGAMPCMSLFSLDDFMRELDGFEVRWNLGAD
jgi:saccharopine dehydrogenase-like NADP-dependent oxidoreductase